ncbi:MAG: transglutaminase domain-containing protein [Nanoarchaeota archaeon]|nr:transglutaminase domain-containing protein [Nanoarchaeota archaeon]
MKKLVIIFLLLLLPIATAQVENYNNYTSLTTNIEITSELEKTVGSLNYILAKLSFYPQEYNSQTILSQEFTSTPSSTVTKENNIVNFRWEENTNSYTYSIITDVKTTNNLIKVYDELPVNQEYSEDISIYTLPTEYIDINEDIENLAEEITAGEDDLYKTIFMLADWTEQNIKYNLSTLNSNAVKSSSWVLENREGVCDELTNLFISMVRSRGIPARFVSGLVYTNTIYDFGPHGWAEVYIDGQWIPFDVTFGTFGWVDPSHIKFKDGLDSGESSVSYEWVGDNIEITTGEIDINAVITEATGKIDKPTTMNVEALSNNVGPGSFVPIQINLENSHNYYLPLKIIVTKAPDIEGPRTKAVLLKPNEEKTVFFIASIPEEFEDEYIYTTTIEIQTMFGNKAQTDINYARSYNIISLEDAESIIDNLEMDEEKEYLTDLDLDCSLNQEKFYRIDTAIITCTLTGNLENVKICLKEDCQSASKFIQWTLDLNEYTSQRLAIIAEKEDKIKSDYVDLRLIEAPEIQIINLEPTIIDFTKENKLSFKIKTNTPIEDITINIDNYGEIAITTLEVETDVLITFPNGQITNNELEFVITFKDELGKEYTQNTTQNITIINIPWYFKIVVWIQNFF